MVDGLWVSVSDLAKAKGVTKQAASKRVARLERDGLITTRMAKGGLKTVNLAEFDRAVNQHSSPAQTVHDESEGPVGSSDPVYAKELAREKAYKADLAKLDLDERLGKLVPVDEVTKAAIKVAERFVKLVDQLPARADDVAAAVAKDGSLGARSVLKDLAYEIRDFMAAELSQMASGSRASEPTYEADDEA